MGTNHGGVNFGRRSPPIGGQFSTLNNSLTTQSLSAFVDTILQRMIFDGEELTDLMEPLGLGWRERRERELALMADLVPLLNKRADKAATSRDSTPTRMKGRGMMADKPSPAVPKLQVSRSLRNAGGLDNQDTGQSRQLAYLRSTRSRRRKTLIQVTLLSSRIMANGRFQIHSLIFSDLRSANVGSDESTKTPLPSGRCRFSRSLSSEDHT